MYCSIVAEHTGTLASSRPGDTGAGGHGERGEGGDLEDINTDRDPPGLNDQIKYN